MSRAAALARNRTRIGKLRYPHSEKLHSFRCVGLPLRPGDTCVAVKKDGSEHFAEVRTIPGPLPLDAGCTGCMPKVVRKATAADLAVRAEEQRLELHARQFFREKADQRGLPMKLLYVEKPFNSRRLIFHFAAEERVDFRELVKDLAHMYGVRIEMRQDGPRDHAATAGGIGPCGKELCCATHLDGFPPISVKMAKQQGVPLTDRNITGMCGRLKCCLRYEYEPGRRTSPGARKRKPAGPATPPPAFDV